MKGFMKRWESLFYVNSTGSFDSLILRFYPEISNAINSQFSFPAPTYIACFIPREWDGS